jgi:peroxiredoxin
MTCVTLTSRTRAEEKSKGVKVGDKAPIFSELPGTNGETIGMVDFRGKEALVVTFTCNKCPVAVAYEDRLINFVKEYKDKGIGFIAINVNDGENLEAMKTRAEEKGFNFPYVFDESQKTAREYGARVTPHIFLVDKTRTVVYVGPFDDSMGEPTKNYLKDAVDAVLAGKTPEVTEAKPVGCGIRYRKEKTNGAG